MAQAFFDSDADLSVLAGRTVGILGYGNQGRSQALNLRDSGVAVIVGNQRDASFERAVADGFAAYDLSEAAARADILALLIPDEVMPEIFAEQIRPHLADGVMLILASGYNLYYRSIDLPPMADVAMIAPRMIGTGVRETYLSGEGFPSLLSVEQDHTGQALPLALAYARGIGSTRAGVFLSSAEEETVCDLFNEHFGYVYALRRAYEVLTEAGYSPEAVLLEFYASGEEMELARAHAYMGLFHQLVLHSQTSQYGQLVTGKPAPDYDAAEKARLRALIDNIRDGRFAREWKQERESGLPAFLRAQQEALSHPMIAEERRLFEALKRRQGDPSALFPDAE
ncbi:MAG TPA: ketol-acid reductoisomerase [Chloroflexota bacterium]|nr:ketol-acid reductoisomerase [Chloroflexota bacterium]